MSLTFGGGGKKIDPIELSKKLYDEANLKKQRKE